jgi:uncharacterized protein (TIGR02284 family)
MAISTESNQNTLDHLNSFLRGELAAVETYRQAIPKLSDVGKRATLQQCEQSHSGRVQMLREEIERRGGHPADSSGVWGSFAKLVQRSADTLGDKAAIAALEEGEDHGRDDYKRDLSDLDAAARQLIEQRVLPEQLRTHQAMSALKHGEP